MWKGVKEMKGMEDLQAEATQIIQKNNLEKILFNNRNKGETEWKVQDFLGLLITEILEQVQAVYEKVSFCIKEQLRSYDGYLLPLREEGYLRVLSTGKRFKGFVYYYAGKVVRVLRGYDDRSYCCTFYESKIVRGAGLC